MDWYYYIALAAVVSQLLFMLQTYNNYRFALRKHRRKRSWYRPRTVLIVPCKGLDSAFRENITSFFNLDYENYLLWFVVADESDPAYAQLCDLKERLATSSKAKEVQVLVAGLGQSCSQKIHNLLYCYKRIDDLAPALGQTPPAEAGIDVMAFADSDVCVRSNWLSHLVYPLRKEKNGASSGYRWFVPKKNNVASLALSALNAKIAQLLGNTRFNQAWGGSMAIRVDVFRRLGLDKTWQTTLSDDLSLSGAVKKAGMKVAFVPACLVASHEATTWRELLEFGRRQFLITRVSAPRTWWFGLCSSLYSVLGLWGGAAMALYAARIQSERTLFFASVPILFFLGQLTRAILRQRMAFSILVPALAGEVECPVSKMRAACWADCLAFWFWSLVLLLLIVSSAFGRTIRWRGIRYKLLSATETIVLDKQTP